jgi:hypothetical protein
MKMNGQQYWKWDFALPVLVPVLEMGCQFPVQVIALEIRHREEFSFVA